MRAAWSDVPTCKECQQPPEAEGDKEQILPRASGGNAALPPGFQPSGINPRHLASRTVREYISDGLSHQIYSNLSAATGN